MKKERKPIFQRSFIPKIFFAIVSCSLVMTLSIIKKNQQLAAENEINQNALLCGANKQNLQIPEVSPDDITDLTLYVCNDCPYCTKVTSFLRQEKLNVPIKNVESDHVTLNELSELTGGKQQVPCLKMGDTNYLFESSEIIKQLKYVRKERPTLLVHQTEVTETVDV